MKRICWVRNKQSLNNWNGIHNSYHTEFSGDVTQHVQTITTSKRRENNNGDRNIRQRPGNLELQPTKFLSDDVTDVDTTLLLTIPFKQDKSSLQQTRCAQRNKPANSVYIKTTLQKAIGLGTVTTAMFFQESWPCIL